MRFKGSSLSSKRLPDFGHGNDSFDMGRNPYVSNFGVVPKAGTYTCLHYEITRQNCEDSQVVVSLHQRIVMLDLSSRKDEKPVFERRATQYKIYRHW